MTAKMPCVGQDFNTYQFAATGSPAKRTQPNRESDIINVKDWGALGDGSNDDQIPIQNAIDYCISTTGGKTAGGIVFFPAGDYKLNGKGLTVGSSVSGISVALVGSGGSSNNATFITTTYSGYMISKGAGNTYENISRIEGLSLTNGDTTANTGCIQLVGTSIAVAGCYGNASTFCDASAANNVTVYDCGHQGNEVYDQTAGGAKPTPTSSVALYLGNNCTAIDCRFAGGIWITFALSGNGANLIGCSTEGVHIAVRVGWGPSGETPAYGCLVQNLQTERDNIGLELYNAHGCMITGNAWTGGAGLNIPAVFSSITWAGGIAEVTTVGAHNIGTGPGPGGTTAIQLTDVAIGTPWRPTFYQFVTVTAADKFTYPLAVDPGAATKPTSWTYNLMYCIRCRIVTESAIVGNELNLTGAYGSVDLDYEGEAQHRNNVFMGAAGIRGWIMPSNSYNLSGWKFAHAGVDVSQLGAGYISTAVGSAMGQMIYNDLPGVFSPPGGGAVFPDGPIEGQEFDIKDGEKSGGGAAVWNDLVQGGASGHYKVRYDGTNWRRIG